MGLDMYVYAVDGRTVTAEEQVDVRVYHAEYITCDRWTKNEDAGLIGEELFYWRKHPNLHGWMEELYRAKGGRDSSFNGSTVRLDAEDIRALTAAVRHHELPETTGFFFGQSGDDISGDLEFIKKAKAALAEGKVLFYDSSW